MVHHMLQFAVLSPGLFAAVVSDGILYQWFEHAYLIELTGLLQLRYDVGCSK